MRLYELDWSGSGQKSVEGFCEHSIKRSGSIKLWEVVEKQRNWLLYKRGPAPWIQLSEFLFWSLRRRFDRHKVDHMAAASVI
jgi:hypothetical protein